MRDQDAWQIVDAATGRFLNWELIEPGRVESWSSAGHQAGRSARWGYVFHDDPLTAGAWTEEHCDRFLSDPVKWHRALDAISLEKRPAPMCGCCGARTRRLIDGRFQVLLREFKLRGRVYWRCEKHVGRNPCCIRGCGKTFALKAGDGRGHEDYSWRMMCGGCWRQAPRWMRDRVTKIRKLARRRGWTDKIQRLHSMAWDACYRAIVTGRTLDMAEVNKLFGWE